MRRTRRYNRAVGRTLGSIITIGLFAAFTVAVHAQAPSFTVTLDAPVHGKVTLAPALPADGKYPAGTVITLTAIPDAGYAIDSTYHTAPGRFGQMPHENPTSEFTITIDQNKHVGASFVEEAVVVAFVGVPIF